MSRTPLVLPILSIFLLNPSADASDWPMARADASRTGRTSEELPPDLSPCWIFKSTHRPKPAWPRSNRMQFDRAPHVVVAGDTVFFGNSVDGKVYALDAASGRIVWEFYTGGPIRFAPVVWKDRTFIASDDGYLYALAAEDGRVLWKHRGGPDGSMRLGNERMISKWPARGGPVVRDATVYYAAGIWPSDGIFLYALNAETGDTIWTNDDSGGIFMPQPHSRAHAKSGVSAQGYLVADGQHLFVPTGRAVPAAFDRTDGRFLYFHLSKNYSAGGSFAMAADGLLYNSGLAFDAATGERRAKVGPGPIVATSDGVVQAANKQIISYRWAEVEKVDRKGKPYKAPELQERWRVDGVHGGSDLVIAGRTIVSGGRGFVDLVDTETKGITDSHAVVGNAYGLAVADGRLFVSTDEGMIYCFASRKVDEPAVVTSPLSKQPYGDDPEIAAAADEILRRYGSRHGYCLDWGCGDGHLAYELARRSELTIFAIDADPEKVAEARRKLDMAGLYGTRVTVHQVDTHNSGYPQYFADLIVSRRSLELGVEELPLDEIRRMQRPYGGVACVGRPGELTVTKRGALPGAGSWTHQYSDPANTVCSDDQLVDGPLGILWFRDVDLELPQRHGRGPAPLFYEGRIFYEGLHEIRAVDAYNGRILWSYSLPDVLTAYSGDHLVGTSGTGSNYCVAGDSVYARYENRCYRIDAATGVKVAEYRIPQGDDGDRTPWGYIACAGGVLFGSRANPDHVVTPRLRRRANMSPQLTESDLLFAYDVQTGDLLWQYKPEYSVRHNAIAIGKKHVYFIDRPLAMFDRRQQSKPEERRHETGELLALSRTTGKVVWRRADDIYGTTLAVSDKHATLLMSYQATHFRLDSEIGGRMSAFRTDDGEPLWSTHADYKSRLTINDRTLYADGGAWDLLTGEPRPFNLKRSYGCGVLSGSANFVFFRSATLGYFDLNKNHEVENFGGMRPGCWINVIPAGGIVMVPDASAGCSCSYLNRSWFALAPTN